MEYQNTNQSLFDLNFNENLKTQLRGAAVWGGIAAILALASTVIGLVRAFMEKNNPPAAYRIEGFGDATMKAQNTGNIFSAVISLIVSIVLFYFLNRFATQTKTGLNGNNPELISNGLGGLSSYFITIGVIVILCLVLLLLAVVGGLAGSR
jgi:small-conductance mechanosensitive channel